MTSLVERARRYLAENAAESGADILISELADEVAAMNTHTRIIPITTGPELPEDVIPSVSPSARPDQCAAIANYVWRKLEQALSDAGEAIRELNSGLHSGGVEDADAILGYIKEHASQLCDNIEAQGHIQREYRSGDR